LCITWTTHALVQEAGILGMHTFFLFTRTLLSIYVAYIDGTPLITIIIIIA
jgi:hypothetical protein